MLPGPYTPSHIGQVAQQNVQQYQQPQGHPVPASQHQGDPPPPQPLSYREHEALIPVPILHNTPMSEEDISAPTHPPPPPVNSVTSNGGKAASAPEVVHALCMAPITSPSSQSPTGAREFELGSENPPVEVAVQERRERIAEMSASRK